MGVGAFSLNGGSLHGGIQSFSLFVDLHQFTIDLVTIELLEDVYLVLELVLGLLGLLCLHLFLYEGVVVLHIAFILL